MKTTKKKEVKKEEKEVKEFNLKEAFVLWNHESKAGSDYLTGYISEDKDSNLIAFYNTNKKNANEPDIRVYLSSNDEKEKALTSVCSLWENIGKNNKRYLSGTTDENERIVAFYNDKSQDKRPYIRAYYKED